MVLGVKHTNVDLQNESEGEAGDTRLFHKSIVSATAANPGAFMPPYPPQKVGKGTPSTTQDKLGLNVPKFEQSVFDMKYSDKKQEQVTK